MDFADRLVAQVCRGGPARFGRVRPVSRRQGHVRLDGRGLRRGGRSLRLEQAHGKASHHALTSASPQPRRSRAVGNAASRPQAKIGFASMAAGATGCPVPMPSIRILPDHVANQIAAGEVIERPASIVKELVENSLDAGATRIEVEFRHGGRSLIRVEDNGKGMSRDDALLSLERHGTSKIREASDLSTIGTFGFRGEAVPSIASVSRFLLQTRTEGEALGTEVLISGGKLLHVGECGMPVGTRITVSHLFNSVPARRKFLKSDATESAHIIQQTRLYALAAPNVSFSLLEDGRALFQSPVCPTLLERVGEIFGRSIADAVLEIDEEHEDMRLRGLIGRPGQGRSTRHEMLLFVNRRPVENNRTLGYALLESYHGLLPKGRYPLAFLFLDLDPRGVDVNVHPSKREVKFREEARIRAFTIRSVLERLRQDNPPAAWPAKVPAGSSPPDAVPAVAAMPLRAPASAAPPPRPIRSAPETPRPAAPNPAAIETPASASAPVAPRPVELSWRFLAMLHAEFALFETTAGLLLLDCRAASERIWHERLRSQLAAGQIASQRLLFAAPMEVDPVVSALLDESLDLLQRHGLEMVPFGRRTYRIESIPAWLEPGQAEDFARDLLGLLRAGRISGRDPRSATEEIARMAASRAAAGASWGADGEAMKTLARELLACREPHVSPAGRPTFVEISRSELARRFQKGISGPMLDLA
jgi:DNA mismatch repair protein MutL